MFLLHLWLGTFSLWLLAVECAGTILTCFVAIYKYFEVIEIFKNLVCKCQDKAQNWLKYF